MTKIVLSRLAMLGLLLFAAGCGDSVEQKPISKSSDGEPARKLNSPVDPLVQLAKAFQHHEQAYVQHRMDLAKVAADPAFRDQAPAIEALLKDAEAIKKAHEGQVRRTISEKRKEDTDRHFLIYFAPVGALYQVSELIRRLPSSSKKGLVDVIEGFRLTHQRNVSRWQPVLAAYARAGVDVQSRYEADPQGLEDSFNASLKLAESVPAWMAADDFVSAYVIQRHATLLMDVVWLSLAEYEDQIYKRSRPAYP